LNQTDIAYKERIQWPGAVMSLKNNFRIIVALSALGFVILAAIWLTTERSRIMQAKKDNSRNLVETAWSVVAQYHALAQEGKLKQEDAQKHAMELVGMMRYEKDNYLWINDFHPRMVMHPTKPELNGADLTNFKDPDGKALFVEMADTVRKNGAGFVDYMWPRPGSDKPVPKLSYVKGFESWGWLIGTGIYMDDVDAMWRQSAMKAAGITLVCLAVLAVAALTVWRRLFGRLRELTARVKDVAKGDGDLTKRIHVESQDEVGELANWFNTFLDKLQKILSQVAGNTENLASASEKISRTSREQAQGAETQGSQTLQVATAMQEMAATVQQVSENSSQAATTSQKAAEVARQGGDVVKETLARMHAIAKSVEQTSKKVHDLGERSDQIGQIISVISDIADQTNLLALNAAIEAARAGEQGRGFAVVADEVRKLAERTAEATHRITEMIRTIQTETKDAVAAMEENNAEVEKGVKSTALAGDSLAIIIQMSENVRSMVTNIATASAQQSATTESINSNIDQIAKITAVNAAGAQQTSQALEDLSGLALNLQQLVGQFRLGSNGHGQNGGNGRSDRKHRGEVKPSRVVATPIFSRTP
jgi:methyl-accepting chemotaxis protein